MASHWLASSSLFTSGHRNKIFAWLPLQQKIISSSLRAWASGTGRLTIFPSQFLSGAIPM